MAGGIPLSSGIEIESQRPADARSYNVDKPYVSVAEALSLIPTYKRVLKLEVHIGATANSAQIYWFKDGILDANLILKVEGGAAVDVIDNLLSTDVEAAGSANQLRILKGFIDQINTILTSDDVALDELQELVDYIKINKTNLDSLGIANIAGLVTALDNKIDKVTGFGLSKNDYNDAAVDEVAKIVNKENKLVALSPALVAVGTTHHTMTLTAAQIQNTETLIVVELPRNDDEKTIIDFPTPTTHKFIGFKFVTDGENVNHTIVFVNNGSKVFYNLVLNSVDVVANGLTLFGATTGNTKRHHNVDLFCYYDGAISRIEVKYKDLMSY